MNIFLVIFLILYFILSRLRIDLAIMFMIIALPAYLIRFNIFTIPSTLLEAMILICFFSWFIFNTKFKKFIKGEYKIKNFFEERKQRARYPFDFEIIALLIVSFIAVGVAGFSNPALGIWKAYFFEAILFFILIINIFNNKKGVRKIILSLAVSAFLVSLYAIFQKITGIGIANEFWRNVETRRVVSFFGYPNAVGLYLAPIIMVIFGYLVGRLKEKKISLENTFLAITVIISFLAVYFAKSEGALIALLGALAVFFFFVNKYLRISLVCLIIICSAGIFFNQNLKEYAISKASLMDLSGQIRRQQWSETVKALKDGRIIQGFGLANYKETIKPYHQEGIFYDDRTDPDFRRKIVIWNNEYKAKHWRPTEIYEYPHNIILNFWTELGFLGMILFVWIIIKLMYNLINTLHFLKNKKEQESFFQVLGLLGAIIVIIIHGLVDAPYFKNDLAIIFWLIIALSFIINKINKWK